MTILGAVISLQGMGIDGLVLELLLLSVGGIENGGNMGIFRKGFFKAWSVTCWSQIR